MRPCARLLSAATAGAALLLAPAALARPSAAARDAAMAEAVPPQGVGGCVYFAMSQEARRAVLLKFLSGEAGIPPALPPAVRQVGPRCSGRPYDDSDLPLVGAVLGAFRRTSGGMILAQEFAVGQRRLDEAWRAAPPESKAPFYDVADAFLAPNRSITPPARPFDVAPFASALGLEGGGEGHAATHLRRYFLATALSERSEAQLQSRGARPH